MELGPCGVIMALGPCGVVALGTGRAAKNEWTQIHLVKKKNYYFLYSLCCRPNFQPGKFEKE